MQRSLNWRVIAPVAGFLLVAALVGWQQSTASAAPSVTGPVTDQLAIQVAPSGQYDLGAHPDASTGLAGPSSFDLSYNWPSTQVYTSLATLQSDGHNTALSSPSAAPVDSADRLSNDTIYTAGDIEVKQDLSIVANPYTGKSDLGELSYTLINNGVVSHAAGVRVMIDTDVNGFDGKFNVAGTPVTSESDYTGAAVPQYFNVAGDPTVPSQVALAVLKGSGATTPDRVIIANWDPLVHTLWDYTTTPGQALGDSAYAAYFDPAPLAAGASRTYVTYYGLGSPDETPPSDTGSSTTTSTSSSTTTDTTSTSTTSSSTSTTSTTSTPDTTTTSPDTTTTTEGETTTTTLPDTTTTTTGTDTTTTTTPDGGDGGNEHHHRRHHRRRQRGDGRGAFGGFGWFDQGGRDSGNSGSGADDNYRFSDRYF